MNRTSLVYLAVTCAALLLAPRVSAAKADGVKAALDARVLLEITDRLFEDAVREACKFGGLTSVTLPPARKPNTRSRGSSRRSLDGNRSGSFIAYRHENGRRMYTLRVAKPLSLRKVIAELCKVESLSFKVDQGALVILDAARLTAERPFKPESIKSFNPLKPTVPIDKDWRKAVEFIVKMREKGQQESDEGKTYHIGETHKVPSIQCLTKALAALKGHPEKDAVRAWLLAETARRLWGHYHFRQNSHEGRHGMGQVIAAVREMDAIASGPGLKKNLKELTAVLRPLFADLSFYHIKFTPKSPDIKILEYQLAYGYFGGGQAWVHLGERRKAADSMGKAARMIFGVSYWADMWFDAYYGVLPPKERLAAARADLAPQMKRYEKTKQRLEALPDKWRCPGCGRDKITSLAELGNIPARFQFRVACAYVAMGEQAEAIPHYEAALKLDPLYGGRSSDGSGVRRTNTGWITEYDIKPTAGFVLMGLIRAHLAIGEYDKAITHLKAQFKRTPADARLPAELAKCYEKKGDKAQAVRYYKEYVELSPRNFGWAGARIDILEGRIKPGPQTDLSTPERRMRYEEIKWHLQELTRDRRHHEALGHLRDPGLKTFPNDEDFLTREIRLLEKMEGREKEHEAKLKKLAEIHPQKAWWVESQLKRQVAAKRNAPKTDLYRAVFKLQREKKYDEALEMLRGAYDRFPDQKSKFAQQEVRILAQAKRYNESAKLARSLQAVYEAEKTTFIRLEIDALVKAERKTEARKRLAEFESSLTTQEDRIRNERWIRYIRAKLDGKPFDPGRRRRPSRRGW